MGSQVSTQRRNTSPGGRSNGGRGSPRDERVPESPKESKSKDKRRVLSALDSLVKGKHGRKSDETLKERARSTGETTASSQATMTPPPPTPTQPQSGGVTGEGGEDGEDVTGPGRGPAEGAGMPSLLQHDLLLEHQQLQETTPKVPPNARLPISLQVPQMSPASATIPCQYRTGKTLGSGTYAIVKEAIHIKTGKYYACKVINKKLMEGREYMVRNEIAVLKRVSSGHPNIVTLHDYFETAHNLYLVFDLCTGGELFDRICAKGNYDEIDAAQLVRTVFKAVKYIHDGGIVHRDLKPENLLFRTKKEDADIMIADFGLSRVMEEEKFHLLTEICGTPGYMAPEIFKKTGHGKPVDVWAMGVITYFLLCGYTPFDRDTQQQEMEAIIAGDYKFEPAEYWANVSSTAREFVSECLTIDPASRPTCEQALKHRWLASDSPHFVEDQDGRATNLLPYIQRQFDARKAWRKAVFSITAVKRMAIFRSNSLSAAAQAFAPHLQQYKDESEKEIVDEDRSVLYYDGLDDGNSPKSPRSPPLSPRSLVDPNKDSNSDNLVSAMSKVAVQEGSRNT